MPLVRPHVVDPSLDTARVALVYKAPFDNSLSHVGLGVTASCIAKTLLRRGIWAEVWGSTSGDAVAARLRAADRDALERGQHGVSHVIIHAPWIATCEIAAMAAEFPQTTFVVVSHSNFGFLAADPHAIQLLREAAKLQLSTHNIKIAGNSKKFVGVASDVFGANVTWLPNLYDLSEAKAPKAVPWPGDCLRLGLFGACRILKNGLTAAAAAAELAIRLRVPTELYISERDERGPHRAVQELVDAVPHLTLVNTGWLPWADFRQVVSRMHVLLQPSFTESFNVVTADGIAEGVPTVTSDAIDWVPGYWRADADDAGDVARVAEYLLRSPRAVDDGRAALGSYVDRALEAWTAFFVRSDEAR